MRLLGGSLNFLRFHSNKISFFKQQTLTLLAIDKSNICSGILTYLASSSAAAAAAKCNGVQPA
jgi:hypothetical protein